VFVLCDVLFTLFPFKLIWLISNAPSHLAFDKLWIWCPMFIYVYTTVLYLRPKAEFMNVQFRWGFWASSWKVLRRGVSACIQCMQCKSASNHFFCWGWGGGNPLVEVTVNIKEKTFVSFTSKNSAPAHSMQRTLVKGYKNLSGPVPFISTTSNYLLEIFDSVIYNRCSMYRIIIFTVTEIRTVVNRWK
jgi:hypothetical protein